MSEHERSRSRVSAADTPLERDGKVDLQETIALGAPECRVVVHLRPTDESEATTGREYFASADPLPDSR